ncbi:MAG: DUF5995 family protein [Actinomycetota bacterium]|nr:DUF5995 family protein [Actinomycetota bacterium]
MADATTIEEVLERLNQLEGDLPPDDGVRWFNRLYLKVTEQVAQYVNTVPQAAPGFLERLDIIFANAYFAALDAAEPAGSELPRGYEYHAWKPLFGRRYARDVAPIQFALAGMNAHINHDLALGVQQVCTERGVRPDRDAPEYDDYTAVNRLIKQTEEEVKVWLLTDCLKYLDRRFGAVDDMVVIWSVERARAAAWVHSEVLWLLSDEGFVEQNYREVLDRTVGGYSRALLKSVGVFEGGPVVPIRAEREATVPVLRG